MWLARSAIRRPVFTTVAVIIVLVMGFVALNDLQMDLLPDIQPPVGAVVASYPGAGPEEVLDKVTQPLERQLGTLPGLKNIQSQTREGSTLVLLEFEWSQDINQLQNDVISRINQTSLPDDVDTPSFLKFDPSTFPIIQLSVMTKGTSDKELREDIHRISQNLSQLPGVASADASGLREQQIRISLDAEQMKKHHLSQSDIRERIQATQISQPGGIIHKGDQDLTARVSSELTSLKQFRELELAVDPRTGKKITLDDVADVRIGKAEQNVITRTNNKPSIGINVFKQSGANTAEVSRDVRAELDRLSKKLDVDTHIIFDQGKYVDMAIQNVSDTMVMGGILAMLILFLFLRSFRSPLIIGVAIPFSVITTFVLMYLSDFTLNIMTLGGLALGIGMLVDNSIVVIENIHRHLQQGEDHKQAAIKGAGEVAGAVTASTLTTVFVFVPVVFVSGIVGQLFREFAFTVTFSLLASLLVALTLVPMMAARIMKRPKTGWGEQREQSRFYRGFRKLLQWSLTHRFAVILISLALLGAGAVGVRSVGTEYLPASDEGIFIVDVKMPQGTGLDKTQKVSAQVESILAGDQDIKTYQASMGSNRNAIAGESGRNISQIHVTAVDKSERKRSTRKIMNDLRPKLAEVDPDVEVELREQSSFEAAGAPNTLEFRVSGDKEDLQKWSGKIHSALRELDMVRQVTDSQKETQPELVVSVDRKQALKEGLVPAQIVTAVSNATRGQVVTQVDVKEGSYDVFLHYDEVLRDSPDRLKKLPIQTPGGGTVPLSKVADLEVKQGPITINRSDLLDSIEYKVQYDGTDLGTVEQAVQKELDRILPSDLTVKFTGGAELLNDAMDDLLLAAGLAVLFVFLVLAAQFESFKYPFVIMLTLPLMVIGVAAALWLTQTPVGVTAMIGLIVLTGIVVNNAIVLVDYINQLKARGVPSYEAIVDAGITRLRPILMTATTTVLGLVPLALGWGEGTEIQQPMAIVVIGGLFSSTLLTLLVIPVVYSWFDPETRRMKKAPQEAK
ncbi:efflux RND transporter permease subunit [Kroppenstedtia eburnea]|uniref:efflux RND transporter permease subunit n=1 Tax=Kroppenstedtia eburnea TaxID=714067 RepID=UPI0036421D38